MIQIQKKSKFQNNVLVTCFKVESAICNLIICTFCELMIVDCCTASLNQLELMSTEFDGIYSPFIWFARIESIELSFW